MDDSVLAAMAKWPNVPEVFGWLSLDARGQWRLRGEPLNHPAMLAFIQRNYTCDRQGRAYFQNGPQRVYVTLEAAPYIARFRQGSWQLHDGEPVYRGLFKPIGPAALPPVPFGEVAAPDYSGWAGRGAEMLVHGAVSADASGALSVDCRLYDVKLTQGLVNSTWHFAPGDWRRAAVVGPDWYLTRDYEDGHITTLEARAMCLAAVRAPRDVPLRIVTDSAAAALAACRGRARGAASTELGAAIAALRGAVARRRFPTAVAWVPSRFNAADKQRFANALDKWLVRGKLS